jgi:ribosomal protein S25
MAAAGDRRNVANRRAILQRAIVEVLRRPAVMVTADTLEVRLGIARDAAERIIRRLAGSGLIEEVRRGIWARPGWVRAHLRSD